MNLAEVERVSKALKANPGLSAETGKEAWTVIRNEARASGKELSEAQLDKVTGGFGSCISSDDCKLHAGPSGIAGGATFALE